MTINDGNTYTIRAIADGTNIDQFVDGANKITYASASHNQTETKHGFRGFYDGEVKGEFDNFTVFPRDGYSDLDDYIA
jgi:hypothetical protein